MLKFILRHLVLFAAYVFLLAISSAAFAEQQNSTFQIQHQPLTEANLPFPGAEMRLAVMVSNTLDSQYAIKGFVARDGKLMEVTLSDFSADDKDRIFYSTIINAPLAEMKYQFVVMNGDQVVAHTKKFKVSRSCLPNVNTIDTNIDAKTPQNVKVKLLQSQAYGLQDEVKNYETAIKLLDELRVLTEK